MFTLLHKVRDNLRHGTLAHSVLSRLYDLGIGIAPYIIYREDSSFRNKFPPLEYSVELVTLENFERLVPGFVPERQESPDDWRRQL